MAENQSRNKQVILNFLYFILGVLALLTSLCIFALLAIIVVGHRAHCRDLREKDQK
jgi:hypothetical protein